MNRCALALLLLAPLPLSASSLFTGTLTADDQTAAVVFTVNAPEIVTIQSFGYAGGTVDSTVIAAGGFAPSAFVFDNLGVLYAQDINDNDPFIQTLFVPGTYELVIVVQGNLLVDGNTLANGFVEDGQGSFTCAPFGKSGSFCDAGSATGDQRTGDWAFAITGADSAAELGAPEPASYALMGIGGAVAGFLRRRRQAAR